ncbi:MAG: serine hydrolase [Bacteroidetes bacterium]|nr:serine hydrolase [Bacteroidota bacterium]
MININKILVFIVFATSQLISQQFINPLEEYIKYELNDKNLPSISIAIVDSDKIIYANGFGFEDAKKTKLATANTIYRVGSVSKLFTDIAIMQLVEKNEIDIDLPVSNYLPDFKPENSFNKNITLRHLMTHRSGLVRESPVGSYFDPTAPSIKNSVESIYKSKIVYEPGTKTKYSNAAINTVGYVLEKIKQQPFDEYISENLLNKIGMTNSSFHPTTKIKESLADAVMWSYDGRETPAPTFRLGIAAAGNLYCSVNEAAKFIKMLASEGMVGNNKIISSSTLNEMYKVQFSKDKSGFGIGFAINQLDGFKKVGHGGAVFGFATSLSYLPEKKIGVIVASSMDVVNSVTERIANYALRLVLAEKSRKDFPKPIISFQLTENQIQNLKGVYESETGKFEFLKRGKKIILQSPNTRAEVRSIAKTDTLILDDKQTFGGRIFSIDKNWNKLFFNGDTLNRIENYFPKEIPDEWKGLIGEYGFDHIPLYILELHGKLTTLIEWTEFDPLTKISKDIYAFPNYNMYHGEKLIFERDKNGKAISVTAAGIKFERRNLDGEDGSTFKINPLNSYKNLFELAKNSTPPIELNKMNESKLVEVKSLDNSVKYDIRYASTNNFMGEPFYKSSKAFLQSNAANAFIKAQNILKQKGYSLLIHDAYRPWYVTKMFWEATPNDQKLFVADPLKGSRHNRGCAVDVTLFDLKISKPIKMVSTYDEFSPRAFPDYPGGTTLQRFHRELLRTTLEEVGFNIYEWEWWHFDFKGWQNYPIHNQDFEELN